VCQARRVITPADTPLTWAAALTCVRQAVEAGPTTLICMAGTSQSGKSTGAQWLREQLEAQGHAVEVVSTDSFAQPTALFDPQGNELGHDQPGAFDLPLLEQMISSWRQGQPVQIPLLRLHRHEDGSTELVRTMPEAQPLPPVLIVEGLYAHYLAVSRTAELVLFVHDPDLARRSQRRLERDVQQWGYTPDESRATWQGKTLRGEAQHVMPEVLGDRCRVDLWVDADSPRVTHQAEPEPEAPELTVVYARDEPPRDGRPSIFLVGPTPRSPEVPSWRPEAVRLLREQGFTGMVFYPEEAPGPDGISRFTGEFDAQVAWEHARLREATVILAYVPRDMATMPALTTNVEFGLYATSGKLVRGSPPTAQHNAYLEYIADHYSIPWARSLPETVGLALRLLDEQPVSGRTSMALNDHDISPA
jgi:uridine kinase